MGHAGYYRHFIEKISKLASPLFTLLMKDTEFNWIDAGQVTFVELKRRLSTTLILCGTNQVLPFHIFYDASCTTIGAVLGQHEDHNPYAKYYISKNMDPIELNYTVTEK